MNNIKKMKDFLKENVEETPFKVGMKIDKVENDWRSGKLVFHCNDGKIIDVAPGGGASIIWDGNIKEIINSTITEVGVKYCEIDLSFDNADDLYMADDTGGEGLEAWIR